MYQNNEISFKCAHFKYHRILWCMICKHGHVYRYRIFFSEHHTITHNKDYKITTHNLEENLMYNINNNKMYTWACALSYDT